jgi:hypothetical protein
MIDLRILSLTAFLATALASAEAPAAPPPEPTLASEPPPPARTTAPKRAKRELIAGGVLLGLGFAAELSGAVISAGCEPGEWCATAIAGSVGGPEGPNRYTFVSTGPSSTYVMGRLAAAPLLLSGFTLTMVGLGSMGTPASDWSLAKRRRVAWSLFGSGMTVLLASRVLRVVFLSTGTCQSQMCVHGFDQSSLWVGRGLTFAGTGLLVRGAARRHELALGAGPRHSYGLSLSGRF